MSGGGKKRVIIHARLDFPEILAARLREMAKYREMELDELLSELVQVGELDLRKQQPKLDPDKRIASGEFSVVRKMR